MLIVMPSKEVTPPFANHPITFANYQMNAARTAIYPGFASLSGLIYCALGLGEAGEVQGKVKKLLRDYNLDIDGPYSHELPEEVKMAIAKELGDVLWYVSMMATELNISLNSIAQDNLNKLASRKARGVLQGNGDDR